MARAKTSDQVKAWEKQRQEAEAARRRTREATDVGERLRQVKAEEGASFHAIGPEGQVVKAHPVMAQQAASLRRVFETDGYTVVK